MSPQITHFSEFDASSVTFSELRKNKMGGKGVYLSKGKEKLLIQLPKLRMPFGLGEYTDQASGRTSYSVDLSLQDQDDLRGILEKLDAVVVDQVKKNSKSWLGKTHSEDVIKQALYKPVVKLPQDDKYAPTIKIKVVVDSNNNFVSKCFNNRCEEMPLKDLQKGQYVRAIAHVSQVWIIDNKCGVTMKLEQLQAFPTDKLTDFAFLDDGEGDEGSGEEAESDEDELIDE